MTFVTLVAAAGVLSVPTMYVRPFENEFGSRNPLAEAFGTLRQASRSRTFWLLAGSFFICGASTNGLIGAHLVPACGDRGIAETRAACTTLAAGWSRTALGTYDDAFLTSGLLCLLGSALVLSIARRPPLEPAFATALVA